MTRTPGVRNVARKRAPLPPRSGRRGGGGTDRRRALYRRPVEPEDLLEWLRWQHRLVLSNGRPRVVYWDGNPVEFDSGPQL